MSSYPKNFIRGINQEDGVIDVEGNLTVSLNVFKKYDTLDRTDGYSELSINWHDNDDAIKFTMEEKKENGDIKYKYGIALGNIKEIDAHIKRLCWGKIIKYERKPIPNNKYHGNFLMKTETVKDKKTRDTIAGMIALYCELLKQQ